MNVALLFPGQGAQTPGMGRVLMTRFPGIVKEIDALAAIADLPLMDYCLRITEHDQRATEIAQPVLFALGFAVFREIRRQLDFTPKFYCGHSIGHFTALAASGALNPAATMRVVVQRGRLMAWGGKRVSGGMTAAFQVASERLEAALAASDLRVWRANDNLAGQIVLSGATEDLPAVETLVRDLGGHCKRLNVSGAFHSPLLSEEAVEFAGLLDRVEISAPDAPVILNATGVAVDDPDRIRDNLRGHMTAPVRWVRVMDRLVAGGVEACIECGPGKTLKGLMLRHAPSLPVTETENPRSFLRAMDVIETMGRLREGAV